MDGPWSGRYVTFHLGFRFRFRCTLNSEQCILNTHVTAQVSFRIQISLQVMFLFRFSVSLGLMSGFQGSIRFLGFRISGFHKVFRFPLSVWTSGFHKVFRFPVRISGFHEVFRFPARISGFQPGYQGSIRFLGFQSGYQVSF